MLNVTIRIRDLGASGMIFRGLGHTIDDVRDYTRVMLYQAHLHAWQYSNLVHVAHLPTYIRLAERLNVLSHSYEIVNLAVGELSTRDVEIMVTEG